MSRHMNNEFNHLKDIINCIQETYNDTNLAWAEFRAETVNLKKTLVCDIESNELAQYYIVYYNLFLSYINVHFNVTSVYPDVRARVKTVNSFSDKIDKYNKKHENGKIPINKCLNDLLGFRIILTESYDFNSIMDFIKESFGDKYKCIDASKLSYKAVHVYFRGDNYSFPWELQIWNAEDERSNIESHNIYKQEYTGQEKDINQKELL